MRAHSLVVALGTLCLSACMSGGVDVAAESVVAEDVRPNIVIVITDDQGYGDVGRNGNPVLKTPQIDAFADRSARFTDFHVDPTCSPTRASLMTGQHSMRAGVWHTIMGRSLLPTEKVTIAEHFGDAGYRTGLFGKWHLGDNFAYRPEDQGFQTVVMHGGGGVGQTPDVWGNTQFDDIYYANGELRSFEGNSTDVWFDQATEFLTSSGNDPKLAVIALNAPHRPWRAPDIYVEPYRAAGLPEPMAQFYGMITHLDQRFGELVKLLDDQSDRRDSVIIFMSDNGSALNFAPAYTGGEGMAVTERLADGWVVNGGMRGYKSSVYEGGHRVPFYLYNTEESFGRDITEQAAHFDVLPSLVEMTGITANLDVDGRSFADILSGKSDRLPPRPMVITNQRVFTPSFDRPMAVLDGDWRLIIHKEAGVRELYDLSRDPGQKVNLIEDHPERVDRMNQILADWWAPYSRKVEANLLPVGNDSVVRLTAMDWMEAPSTDAIPWFPGHEPREIDENYPRWIGSEQDYIPLPWYLDIERTGLYELKLRVHDDDSFKIGRDYAIIKVNDNLMVYEVDPEAYAATIRVPMEKGFSRLKVYFTDDASLESGLPAFYVYVTPPKD